MVSSFTKGSARTPISSVLSSMIGISRKANCPNVSLPIVIILIMVATTTASTFNSRAIDTNEVQQTNEQDGQPPLDEVCAGCLHKDMREQDPSADLIPASNENMDQFLTETKRMILKGLGLTAAPNISEISSAFNSGALEKQIADFERERLQMEAKEQQDGTRETETMHLSLTPVTKRRRKRSATTTEHGCLQDKDDKSYCFQVPINVLRDQNVDGAVFNFNEDLETDNQNAIYRRIKIQEWTKHNGMLSEKIEIFTYRPAGKMQIDLTDWVKRWSEIEEDIIYLRLSSGSNDSPLVIARRPRLTLVRTIAISAKRRSYENSLACMQDMPTQCCFTPYTVNFAELGWEKWILHPNGFKAGYCRGSCPPSSISQSPCCYPDPDTMESLLVLYDLVGNGDPVLQKRIPRMIATSCRCAT